MDGFLSWLNSNWRPLSEIATTGIGLGLTAASLRQAAKAKEMENVATLHQHHRDLWSEMSRRPELSRILRPDIDLEREPPTVAEMEFTNLIFDHFLEGWQMATAGTVLKKKTLKKDARELFRLPIPAALWEKTKDCRDEDFVRFVDRALEQR